MTDEKIDYEINLAIGTWLKEHREQHGISQREMARRLNLTNPALHFMETGETQIKATMMIDYCLAMNEDPAMCLKESLQRCHKKEN